jgi:hypothetical protein
MRQLIFGYTDALEKRPQLAAVLELARQADANIVVANWIA